MVLPTTSKNQKIIFLIIFIICLFIQVIPVIKSGLNYSFGLGFWGPNGHDGVWHLSLINHISNPLKIPMPVFSGETLKNYHPFFDILLAYLSKITFIDSSLWLFQIFPLISAALFLYFSYLLGRRLTGQEMGGIVLMVVNTISNSLGWIVTLIRSGSFSGESLFWAMQSPSNQLNPPFMFSILLILILIYLLTKKSPSKIIIFLILVFLPIIKVYSAIPAFIFFSFYVLKNKNYFLTEILSLVFAALLFFQYNTSSSSLIVFKPFWFSNSLIESPDRFFIPYLANMRYSLESTSHLGPRLFSLYIFSVLVFLIGNFSWRLMGLKEWWSKKDITVSILICTLIPLLFIQKGTSWNTIQFLYYALFLANIPLSIFLTKHLKLFTFFVILNLLPLIGSLPNFTGKIPPTAIPRNEIEALKFLKSQPSGIVLTYPYDKYFRNNLTTLPLPLYAYETTSYVAAYSHKFTYLEDEMNLDNSAFNWQPRLAASTSYFKQESPFADRGFLVNNQIDYLYLPKSISLNFDNLSQQIYLENIFENSNIIIYRVKR